MKNKKLIFIIGFMASGKSVIGKLLSERLFYVYRDTDIIIEEREKMSIKDIFKIKGENYFRELEKKVLNDICKNESIGGNVISSGGGMACNDENIALMKDKGIVIYLKSTINDILERSTDLEKRPILKKMNGMGVMRKKVMRKKLEELLNNREKYYNKADFIVFNSNEVKPIDTVELIIENLRKEYSL